MDEKFLKPNKELLRLWREAVRMVLGPVGCSKRPRLRLYQENETMAKNKGGRSNMATEPQERQPGDTPDRFESELDAETSDSIQGAQYGLAVPNPELDALEAAVDAEATNGQAAHVKGARKKPDRSNPPYYEVYSEKDGGAEKKLEGTTETSGKALKFIYLHAARVAGDARKLYVVRCKRLTDAELLD